jgi:hypothetical protein
MTLRLRYTAPWKLATVIDCDNEPCPSICSIGLGGAFHSQYFLEDDGMTSKVLGTDKPPYRVPLMVTCASLRAWK